MQLFRWFHRQWHPLRWYLDLFIPIYIFVLMVFRRFFTMATRIKHFLTSFIDCCERSPPPPRPAIGTGREHALLSANTILITSCLILLATALPPFFPPQLLKYMDHMDKFCLSLQILQVPGKSPFNTERRTKLYKKYLICSKK